MTMNDLKYLFTAELKDGSIYKQNKQDASVKFPPQKDENGKLQGFSCMKDIQGDIDAYNIKKFTLRENSLLPLKEISVDLTDGHFEINGVSFTTEQDKPLALPQVKRKLIYFRVRREQYATPAIYMKPQSVVRGSSNAVIVINQLGERHYYPNVKRMWTQLDDVVIDGKRIKTERTYILPEVVNEEPQYMLGWQCQFNGRNYQQTIVVK